MTPEVKERIDQIRHGIVPEGYIKSKDGIYPGDWTSKKMGQWLQLMERPISLEDDEKYELVTVRRGFGGVDSRGTYLGKNVLVKNYFCLCTGDFVISKRQIAHGACGVVPAELDGAVVSNEYNVFIPQEGTNINMFNLMMKLPHYRRLFYLMSDGVHIEKLLFKTDDWMRRSLAMPSLEEQERIASILSMQDKIIELEQQKIEEIKKAKRFFLEKMFPKKGQAVPEIRFKRFTAPWKQRKLGELALFNPKDELPQTFEYVDLESVVGTEMLSHRTEAKLSAPSRAQRLAHTGDLFYQTVRPYQKNNYLFEKSDNNYVFSTGYAQMRPYVDGYFLFSLVQSERLVKVVLDNCTGTSYPAINANDLAEIEVAAPSDENEAQKIGIIFRSIDNLITLHQRKLEEEKRKKKALMQLLLTGLVRVNA